MFVYQPVLSAGHEQSPVGTISRPAVLTAAVATAAGVAVLNVFSSLTLIAGATELAKRQVAEHPGAGSKWVSPDLVDPHSDRVQALQTIFASLGYVTVFWALVLGALVFFALRGGRAVRVIAIVILVISAVIKAADLTTPVATLTGLLDGIVALLALVAAALFLDAGQQHACVGSG